MPIRGVAGQTPGPVLVISSRLVARLVEEPPERSATEREAVVWSRGGVAGTVVLPLAGLGAGTVVAPGAGRVAEAVRLAETDGEPTESAVSRTWVRGVRWGTSLSSEGGDEVL
ncbi:hypothetical protein ACIBL3_07790 [Kribbella sp. NPDC050124]|uniref:hypothetical protein n=1 Tax=Kribbella sp. NPDC050124 TaxID=3364114 RepID=UPI0037A07614